MTALWPLWITALALLLLTLGGLLWPLLRDSAQLSAAEPDTRKRLRQIYRAQREELEREHQRQAINDEDYAQAIDELARRLLEDIDNSELPALVTNGVWRRRIPAALLTVLMPIGALTIYLQVGDPRAAISVALGPSDTHASAGVDVEAMVAQLEQRLRDSPDDLQRWIVLARSREVMEEFDASTKAYQRAISLAKQQNLPADFQARLHADLADTMASARDGALDKPVQAVLENALALDPDQPKALALAGMAALREGDSTGARRHWQRLLGLLEPDSDMALRVQNDLARLSPGAEPTQSKVPRGTGLSGTVRVAAALRDRVQPSDTVFIVARAPEAGRMPVAVLRIPAAQLPADFTLNDSNAMSPNALLSRFDQFTIEARVSRSGTAQRQPGQPFSESLQVRRGSKGLELIIGSIEP